MKITPEIRKGWVELELTDADLQAVLNVPYEQGLPRWEALQKRIKSRFRARSLELHPDRNPDIPEALERLQHMNQAWDWFSQLKFSRRAPPPAPPQRGYTVVVVVGQPFAYGGGTGSTSTTWAAASPWTVWPTDKK